MGNEPPNAAALSDSTVALICWNGDGRSLNGGKGFSTLTQMQTWFSSMTQKPFNPFSVSESVVPKGWIAVADVYARIALDFFNQLGVSSLEAVPLSKLAGSPPDRHDAHSTPYVLTWRVLSYCKEVARLEQDGSVTALSDRKLLETKNEWTSANAHMSLPEGRLGSGVDKLNRSPTERDLIANGYIYNQLVLVRLTHVNKGLSEVLLERQERGRPQKGPEAVDVYHRLFPNGHKGTGLKKATAAAKVSAELGKSVTWKTIDNNL